jgi:hypothetical protein
MNFPSRKAARNSQNPHTEPSHPWHKQTNNIVRRAAKVMKLFITHSFQGSAIVNVNRPVFVNSNAYSTRT